MSVLFEKQSGRKIWKVVIVPDNLTYYTIETNGQIAYDSRELIPCDMDRWRTRAAWLQPPAGGVH